MGEVSGCVHEEVIVRGHRLGAEDSGVTMLLTVGATKFGTFVVGMSRSSSSIGGTTMMGTVKTEMFGRLACEALSWND